MEEDYKSRTIIGTIWSQVGRFAEFILTFILSIVLARGLGSTYYGVYSSLIAFLGLFTMAASMGMQQTLSKFIPKYRASSNDTELESLTRKIVGIRTCVLGGLLLGVIIAARPLSALYFRDSAYSPYFLFGAFYIFTSNLSNLLSFYYVANLRTRFVAIINIPALAASIIFSWFLLRKGPNINSILICLGSIYLITLIAYLVKMKNFSLWFRRIRVRGVWAYSRVIWLNNLLGYVLSKQSDIIMLQAFNVGLYNVGFYNIAFSLVQNVGTVLITGLAILSLPIMSISFSRGGARALGKSWRLMISFTNGLSIPALIFLALNVKSIVIFLYTTEYLETARLIQIFTAFTIIGRMMGGGTNTAVLYTISKEKTALLITLATGILNVILNLILIPVLGAIGAFIATGTSQLLTSSILLGVVLKNIKPRFPLTCVGKIVLASIISGFLSNLVISTSFLGILISACLFGAVYIITLLILKPLRKNEMESFKTVSKVHKIILYFTH